MQHARRGPSRPTSPVAFVVAVLLALATAAMSPASAHAEDGAARILLMLDASGSMNGADPSGSTKMDAAKRALVNAVGALPPDAQVGLRVYGATQPGGKPTPEACADTQLVVPVGPLNKGALTDAINGFAAKGETPIAHSLAEAAKDLGSDGPRHIILVSDGEESCVPDPCEAVRGVIAQGIDLRIDTVGFGVNDKARNQLRCIADAGGGTYYDAKDADDLESSLRRLSTRAVRPFSVQGTPVTGTPEPADAPVLLAGQYTDHVAGSTQGKVMRHYALRRTMAGSTLRFGLAGRIPYGFGTDGIARGSWEMELTTPDGQQRCDRSWDVGSDTTGMGAMLTMATAALPLDPRTSSPNKTAVACAEASDLLLTVSVGAGRSAVDVPIEIRVIEEPPVLNLAELPSGVAEVPKGDFRREEPARGEVRRVVAGTSFNDALEIAPGTYEVEIVPGETVFVKSRLDWGQGAVFASHGPVEGAPVLAGLGLTDYVGVGGSVYAPDLSQIDSQDLWLHVAYQRGVKATSTDVNEVPEVRFRNRWDSPKMHFGQSRGFAMAGYYYFSVGMNQTTKELAGASVPVQFTLQVTGTPSGAPVFATDATPPPFTGGSTAEPVVVRSPSPEPVAGAADGPNLLPLVGGGLVGVGVLGTAGYLIWRRRAA